MKLKVLLGSRVKNIRLRRKITQERLAEMININPKYLSSIERGKENPTLSTLMKIAEALEIDFEELFTSLQFENPENRKDRIIELLEHANEDQLKTIEKMCKLLIY